MSTCIQFELEFQPYSGLDVISPKPPLNLQELLDEITKIGSSPKDPVAMFRSTAQHLSRWLNKQPTETTIDELADCRAGFKAYLQGLSPRRHFTRSYLNFYRMLLQRAKQFGWNQEPTLAEKAWQDILPGLLSAFPSCRAIVQYATRNGITPATFSEGDLETWVQTRLKEGRSYRAVLKVKQDFRRYVFKQGLDRGMPELHPPENRQYGVTAGKLPEPLRTEIQELLAWKMAPFSPGRSGRSRLRLVTALGLQKFFSRVYGFLKNVKGREASRLGDLLNKELFIEYIAWCLNMRRNRSRGLAVMLGKMFAALRSYPPLHETDLKWIPQLISDLPEESEELSRAVKQRKWVPYDELCQVPLAIRKELAEGAQMTEWRAALKFQSLLLITWFLTLPWRQRNVRECKVLPVEQGGNLFKARIPPLATIAKPAWVVESLKTNPKAEFWQIHFRSEETKTGNIVHTFLPKQLIPLVEDFLAHHRPQLLRGEGPDTLFVNAQGRPYTQDTTNNLVGQINLRYAGRRVNPHLMRDIFAVKWLEDYPEDYLTLSKILWHRDVNTTIRIYGRNFDESHGVRRVEQWLDERLAEVSKTHKSQHGIRPAANPIGVEEQSDKGPKRPDRNRNRRGNSSGNPDRLHFGMLTEMISEL